MPIDIDISHYNTGTATVSANGTAVTGQGTTWLGAVRAGDLFGTHKGDGTRILSVNSNTSLTLAYPWTGGAQTAAAYEIQRTPYDIGYHRAVEELISSIDSGNLPMFAALAGASNTLPYFDSANSMDTTALTAFARSLLGGANAAGVRSTLGLGTMATLAAGTGGAQFRTNTQNDARFMRPGDFGLGVETWASFTTGDANDLTTSGTYILGSSSPNIPGGVAGFLWASGRRTGNCVQLFFEYFGGTEPTAFIRLLRNDSWSPWRPLTPESGSNANGSYVRFADGTQICTHTLDLGPRDAVGSGTYTNPYRTSTPNWTFPAAFINSDVQFNATAFVDTVDAAQRAAFVGARANTSTVVNQVQGYSGSDASGSTSITAAMVAIGRWF